MYTAVTAWARAHWAKRDHTRTSLILALASATVLLLGLTALAPAQASPARTSRSAARLAWVPNTGSLKIDLDHELRALPGVGRAAWAAAGPSVSLTTLAPPAPRPAPKPVLPVGKGMWFYQYSRVAGSNPGALINVAKWAGLTHVYVRLGSTVDGFYGQASLDQLLHAAHRAGIKVVGWDFLELHNPIADADRAAQEINYTTPSGDRIDAFSADIETPSEGTDSTAVNAAAFGARLRWWAGPSFPLIAAVPRPCSCRSYPYYEATKSFDAIAPMVYWINRDPVSDVLGAIDTLNPLGKPIMPVGQSYDPSMDGQAYPNPTAGDLTRFMNAALSKNVASVSFWSWDAANQDQWSAIAGFHGFDLGTVPAGSPGAASGRIAAIQRALKNVGHYVPVDGRLGAATHDAIADFQRSKGLTPTGQPDAGTVASLTKP